MFNFNLDALLTGGVAGVVVAAIFRFIDILMNKKVRSSADITAQRRADVVERNEIIVEIRAELKDAKVELKDCHAEIERLENADDAKQRDIMALEHYIYKCLGKFHQLGLANEIPKPTPFEKKVIEHNQGDENGRA